MYNYITLVDDTNLINFYTSFPRYPFWREAVASTAESLSAASPRSLALFAPRVPSSLVQRLFGPAFAASRLVSYFPNCPFLESTKILYEKIDLGF